MRIGEWEVIGDAPRRRVARAGRLDALAAIVITVLAWPFPVLRATLSWTVHGLLILLGIVVADWLLRVTSLLLWGRTPAMYLLDLGLGSAPGRVSAGRAMAWASGWTVALVPVLLGLARPADPLSGLPAHFSGLLTRSTR